MGMFRHNSENKGILVVADVQLPESRGSHYKAFSLKLKNGEVCSSNRPCGSLTSTTLRDRSRVYHHHHAQSSQSTLPRVVTKRILCLLRVCRRKLVDLKRLVSTRTEEVGLDKPSGDGTVIIQGPEHSVLISGLLSTGAGEWWRVTMMGGSGGGWCPAMAIVLIVPRYTLYNIPGIIRRFESCGPGHLPVLGGARGRGNSRLPRNLETALTPFLSPPIARRGIGSAPRISRQKHQKEGSALFGPSSCQFGESGPAGSPDIPRDRLAIFPHSSLLPFRFFTLRQASYNAQKMSVLVALKSHFFRLGLLRSRTFCFPRNDCFFPIVYLRRVPLVKTFPSCDDSSDSLFS